ncbi:uncharacterized protein LOC116652664 [Coturnix japonica]|uniref:uncharacterized protein LOC116652664 n=1 Tax=Coturnix japonica TaxID=93934 RepID=UPI0013A5C6CA|nr:uncharacterized protein LOC116652664 [Coturnix japonica]
MARNVSTSRSVRAAARCTSLLHESVASPTRFAAARGHVAQEPILHKSPSCTRPRLALHKSPSCTRAHLAQGLVLRCTRANLAQEPIVHKAPSCVAQEPILHKSPSCTRPHLVLRKSPSCTRAHLAQGPILRCTRAHLAQELILHKAPSCVAQEPTLHKVLCCTRSRLALNLLLVARGSGLPSTCISCISQRGHDDAQVARTRALHKSTQFALACIARSQPTCVARGLLLQCKAMRVLHSRVPHNSFLAQAKCCALHEGCSAMAAALQKSFSVRCTRAGVHECAMHGTRAHVLRSVQHIAQELMCE